MTQRYIAFLVALRKLNPVDVSPQMFIALYAIRAYPGDSYSGIADRIAHPFASVYKSVRHLMKRGFVEDRRVITNEKTPGALHVTPAGVEFLTDVLGTFDGDGNPEG